MQIQINNALFNIDKESPFKINGTEDPYLFYISSSGDDINCIMSLSPYPLPAVFDHNTAIELIGYLNG
jgi:hypothetical protein